MSDINPNEANILETIDARMQQENYRISVDELKQFHRCAMELHAELAHVQSKAKRLRETLLLVKTVLPQRTSLPSKVQTKMGEVLDAVEAALEVK
jgi:hypothetical protein